MKHFCVLLMHICCLVVFSQDAKLNIDTVDTPFYLSPNYYIDHEHLDLEYIQQKTFTTDSITDPKVGVAYWRKFHIKIDTTLAIKTLGFTFKSVDKIKLYAPQKKGGYKTYVTGIAITRKIVDFTDLYKMYIDYSTIDFNKPFYTKNIPMSAFGIMSVFPADDTNIIIAKSDFPTTISKADYNSRKTHFIFSILLGTIIVSFFFFLINYLITLKTHFLFYAIYLLCIMVTYSVYSAFFYNFYSKIHPILYFYINVNGQLLATFFYLFFLKSYVDIKRNYPKILPYFNVTIGLFTTFVIVYNSIIIRNPFFEHHRVFYETAIYSFFALSLIQVTIMLITKKLMHSSIVFIGSLLLTIGYILAIEFSGFIYLIPIIIVETLLFMSVIAYTDLKNFKKGLISDKLIEINNFKTKFFTNISHELRTPLTLISGPIQDHLKKESLSLQERENFEMINRNTIRLQELVNQLLDIAKIDSEATHLKVADQPLKPFIGALFDNFLFAAKQKDIDYTSKIKIDLEHTWFDTDTIEKIVVNLISNAIKYTPDNGTVICEAFTVDTVLNLVIKNTGKLLTKEQRSKLFDRFYQVGDNQQGFGLGLTLVYELVKLHKGSISVKNRDNKWIVFKVTLPVGFESYTEDEIIIKSVVNKKPKIKTHKQLPLHKKRKYKPHTNIPIEDSSIPIVLIVDDNEDVIHYISSIFNGTYKVISAVDGIDGIEKAIDYIPDIIISDVMMPNKNGIELCKTLKSDSRTSHIPIILLTAKAGEDNELQGYKVGADDYIVKPFNQKMVELRVKKLIEIRQQLQLKYQQQITKPTPKTLKPTTTEEKFLTQLQHVLDKKIIEPAFTVEKFSACLGMSRMQLHRKLKALTGKSTSEFIRFHRVKMAAKLLRESKLSISEIGYKVGFNNHNYFSKSFKEFFKCSPSEYLDKSSQPTE